MSILRLIQRSILLIELVLGPQDILGEWGLVSQTFLLSACCFIRKALSTWDMGQKRQREFRFVTRSLTWEAKTPASVFSATECLNVSKNGKVSAGDIASHVSQTKVFTRVIVILLWQVEILSHQAEGRDELVPLMFWEKVLITEVCYYHHWNHEFDPFFSALEKWNAKL